MTKMLIVWMIFGSRLLSSFSMSAFYSFFQCLRYTANRHWQVWIITTQVYDRLGATYFLTLVWVATHAMALITYFKL